MPAHHPSKFAGRLLLAILVSLAACGAARSFAAQQGADGGATIADLKEQLLNGLRARTPSERAFIDRVVAKVKDGTLPRSLVDSTFLWAQNRQPYPMPYFERALKIRAKRLGFDF